jgi:hypothetical protein
MEIGLTAGVTGQQRMLYPPRHLILLLLLLEVRVALHSTLNFLFNTLLTSLFDIQTISTSLTMTCPVGLMLKGDEEQEHVGGSIVYIYNH